MAILDLSGSLLSAQPIAASPALPNYLLSMNSSHRALARIVVLWCLSLTAASAITPAAPSDLSVSATNYGGTTGIVIFLNWTDNSNNEDGFEVQYRIGTSGAFTSGGTLAADSTSGSLSGVTAGLTLQWQVRATKAGVGNSASAFSNIATVKTNVFDVPFNLTVTATSPFKIRLRWEEASTTESGYEVEIRQTGQAAFSLLGTVGADGISPGVVSGFEPATTYEWRVRAYIAGGTTQYTAYSNIATVTTPSFSAPSNFTVTPVSQQPKFDLVWQDNTTVEDGFAIEVRGPREDFRLLTMAAANTTSYATADPAMIMGTTYEFRIRATLGTDSSAPTGPISASTDGVISSPDVPISRDDPFSYQMQTAGVGTTRISWTLANVPPGLTFDDTTGLLSGTPSVGGLYECLMTANFANGYSHSKNLTLRIITPPASPQVTSPAPWNATPADNAAISLSTMFADPDTESALRVTTNAGNLDFILFNSLTPQTVTNFMQYVNDGDLVNTFFHRSVPSFVIQGGGFKPAGNPNNYASVPTDPSPPNEPGISNLRGTLSMAKLGGNPNSATCQFFVSLNDNSGNLDQQNGGFTVFGRVSAVGMATADLIAGLPTNSYPSIVDGFSSSGLLTDCPIYDISAPATMDQSKLVVVQSITPLPVLTYTLTGNSNPQVVTADVTTSPGQVLLTGHLPGQSTISVQATDVDGNIVSTSLAVELRDTFSSWSARQSLPGGQAGPLENADGDMLNNLQEFAFLGNPLASDSAEPPAAGITDSSPSFLTLTFPIRSLTQGLHYTVEGANSTLGPWTTVWTSTDGFTHAQVAASSVAPNGTLVTIKDTAEITAPGRRFLRVKIEQQ